MMTSEQIQEFDTLGASTVDTPITQTELSEIRKAVDEALPFKEKEPTKDTRYRLGMKNVAVADPIVDLIQHPFFEETSKQVLRAEDVEFWGVSITKTYPNPFAEFSFYQHVDIQYCSSDLDATPRRMICSFFYWLADVNEKRAPLVIRPGSHRLIAEHRESDPDTRNAPIEVKGVMLEDLPELGYADPVPVVGKAGQMAVTTTSIVHGPSTNVDTEPRYAAHITFVPKGMEVPQAAQKMEALQNFYNELRERVRDERKHIIKPAIR